MYCTITSDKNIIDDIRKSTPEKHLDTERASDGIISVYIPPRVDLMEMLKELSGRYPESKIEAEAADNSCMDETVKYFFEYLGGKGGQTGYQRKRHYMFDSLNLGKETDKIYNALSAYFEKVDEIPEQPESISVTMNIDDYKVSAEKDGIMVKIKEIQKKTMREAWEPVDLSAPALDVSDSESPF
jgi:hypothetical protein